MADHFIAGELHGEHGHAVSASHWRNAEKVVARLDCAEGIEALRRLRMLVLWQARGRK